MKKFALIALAFVLVLSLTACGRNDDTTTQDNNQTPSTDLPILPDTTDDDTTNIPDPEVNSNSTADNNGTADNGASNNGTTDNGTGNNTTTDNGTNGNGMTGNNTTANAN